MLDQVMETFNAIDTPLRLVDGTLGLGGYSEAMLRRFPRATVFGIDRDPQALEMASRRLQGFGERFYPLEGNFADMSCLLSEVGAVPINGVVFDLGVSNMQLSLPERGFSFRENGPLDMRMDGENGTAPSAADLLEILSTQDICDIFRRYGEERFAWPIAKAIDRHRKAYGRLKDTDTLVSIIRETLPAPVMRKAKGHPARKVFQALRIAVNQELDSLDRGLDQALEILAPQGVIVVVDYHSLEDRPVKWRFREWANAGTGVILTRKALLPSEREVEKNPKSRSAKLRAFMKK
ncbi:MAG: 16S rRNA (cytosine(1402)-N(4))-methyltransferase [Dethiosulfovibrio peptidovorans]|nr:MAG: 16S rRNA (cytosine(1402)-N(4))-methyltransferase [Dethiosulfovibrio peptidovorans]